MRTEYDDLIRAWLDGAEVEEMHPEIANGKWYPFDGDWILDGEWQYRIAKPAKEQKYLWVYGEYLGDVTICLRSPEDYPGRYLGKIRLEE